MKIKINKHTHTHTKEESKNYFLTCVEGIAKDYIVNGNMLLSDSGMDS